MTAKKKEFESELIVTNVGSQGEKVILNLRFAKPRFEKPTQRIESVIEPLAKSEMEKVGREVAKGYMSVVQKQMQQQMQQFPRFITPTSPPDTIRITLSKQEYAEIGRPTVDDKLVLRLRMKTAQR